MISSPYGVALENSVLRGTVSLRKGDGEFDEMRARVGTTVENWLEME